MYEIINFFVVMFFLHTHTIDKSQIQVSRILNTYQFDVQRKLV